METLGRGQDQEDALDKTTVTHFSSEDGGVRTRTEDSFADSLEELVRIEPWWLMAKL